VNFLHRFIFKLRTFRSYGDVLNRRTDVENVLRQVASGKREPLTAQDCRELADKLGIPEGWR
jgi:hypothetical protein